MAVIITDMDMPMNCSKCVFKRNYRCNDYGHFSECYLDDYCQEVNLLSHDRPKWCPLKSVDGLIKSILAEILDPTVSDAYVNGLFRAAMIIQEYCGMVD